MPEIRDPDDIQKAHDCLWAFVMGKHPLSAGLPEKVRLELPSIKGARAALEGMCWVLKHEHSDLFQKNLDGLRWEDMNQVPAEE